MIDLRDLGYLYHNYSAFGAVNLQSAGIFASNQKCKEPIITDYIKLALSDIKTNASFVELFCADAYYAMLALHLGAYEAYGIDDNRSHKSNKAEKIASRLGLKNFKFVLDDVNNINNHNKADIVANIGGLYHVSNPKEILEKSYDMAKKYLIVQSVVSMQNNDPDYFESPAPGWTWGSRFNRFSFDNMIKGFGWNIIKQDFNELRGNRKLQSRGSVYYLVEK